MLIAGKFSSRRFFVQLIIAFVLFTLATVIALGVPVTLILTRQIDTQARALLDQASQTTRALIENKFSQQKNLSLLIVDRPTLNQLISDDVEVNQISDYLADFLVNTEVDTITVCNQNGVIAAAGLESEIDLCNAPLSDGFLVFGEDVWLRSSAALAPSVSGQIWVVVAERFQSILQRFSQQSGLDYVLLRNGQVMTHNRQGEEFAQSDLPAEISQYQEFELEDADSGTTPYMSVLIPLENEQAVDLIGLLDIGLFKDLNRQIRQIILLTLIGVSVLGAFVAVLISRRISQPLSQLARSAAGMREGDLATPLTTHSQILEIDQLTNALEDARVSLQHSLHQLRTEKLWIENLLNSIDEGMLTIDEKKRVTYTSDGIERMVEGDASTLLGRSIDEIFTSVPGENAFSMQLPAQNQNIRIPVILNDREVLLSVSTSEFIPPEAGNATRALVLRDVTNEARIHRLMGEFMANITHEFRTPLTALAASVELLVDDLPNLSTQEISQLLHNLQIGIVDLQALIDNLIQASSIEAGRFKVNAHPVQLDAIITDAVNTIEPLITKHQLRLIQPKEVQSFRVMADQRRTSQALINLLSNAIKHSPEGGQVQLRTLILGGDVMIEVEDEGQGISPERQKQLFNRFIQSGDGDSQEQTGLGLGLSVVKAIIEAQTGKVGYKDSDLGGAIFWFTLPMVPEDIR